MKTILALAFICAVVSAQGKGDFIYEVSRLGVVFGGASTQGKKLTDAVGCIDKAVGTKGSGQVKVCAIKNSCSYDLLTSIDANAMEKLKILYNKLPYETYLQKSDEVSNCVPTTDTNN